MVGGGAGEAGGMGMGRRYSDTSALMMGSRDVEDERDRMGHNLRDR